MREVSNPELAMNCVANSIGWAIYSGDGREIFYNDDGVATITIQDDELALCIEAARRAVDTLVHFEVLPPWGHC